MAIFFHTNKIPTVITQFRAYTMVRSTAKPDHVMFTHTPKLGRDSAISHFGPKWLDMARSRLNSIYDGKNLVFSTANSVQMCWNHAENVCLLASQGYDLCPIRELWLMGSKSLQTNLGSAKRYDIWESMPFQGYDLRGRWLYSPFYVFFSVWVVGSSFPIFAPRACWNLLTYSRCYIVHMWTRLIAK